MYGRVATLEPIEWTWVVERLEAAGTYWLATTNDDGTPHPRPVWGVWVDGRLFLSVGSHVHNRNLRQRPAVAVHLGDGVEVVAVHGTATQLDRDDPVLPRFVEVYDPKYSWQYSFDELPPPVAVDPSVVVAWRSAGADGREGFRAAGKWVFGARLSP